jgi:hypothetical protein
MADKIENLQVIIGEGALLNRLCPNILLGLNTGFRLGVGCKILLKDFEGKKQDASIACVASVLC